MNVKIVSPTPIGHGTRVFTEDGAEIRGITAIAWQASVDGINTAQLTICTVATELHGRAVVMAAHPVTEDLGEIKSITFADGSTWTAE